MTTREEKIQVINKVIANKELSFGCRFKLKSGAITIATGSQSGTWITCLYFQQTRIENIGEIIGHPVMIGDTLDWFSETFFDKTFLRQETILKLWKEKRKSIEEQSDECVDFIYNLITNE